MIGIYRITNKINGKCYIGQSVNIKQRWKNHRKDAFWPQSQAYDYPLYQAMRKYGIDIFLFEILEECLPEQLNERECFYIKKYRSYGKGYNQNAGGNSCFHPIKLDTPTIIQIITALKTTTKTNTELADEFCVSEGMIRAINLGSCWPQPNECYPIRILRERDATGKIIKKTKKKKHCKQCGQLIWNTSTYCSQCKKLIQQQINAQRRPPKLELAKMVKEFGFEETGRQFNVSGKAIAKWCQSYEIPHTIKELIDWYDKQMGIDTTPQRIKTPLTEIIKPVKQIDIKTGETIAFFQSIHAAEKAMGKDNTCISRVCRGLQKTAYGYYWQFVQKENNL